MALVHITLDTDEISEIKLALDLRLNELETKLAKLGGYEGGYAQLLERKIEFAEHVLNTIKKAR